MWQTHKQSYTKLYRTWASMKDRCTNKRSKEYKRYGGRGIELCKRWMSFENFYKDMGDRPDGLSLDRIDNNKGYSPSNCRWATASQQSRNTSRNINLTHMGKTMCLSDWSKYVGITKASLRKRLLSGKTVEVALSPIR